MDVEHFGCLSRFSRRGESHEQDGETLRRAGICRRETASSDPAMAFGPSVSPGDCRPGLEIGSAHSLPDETADDFVSSALQKRAGFAARDLLQRRMPSRSISDL
jgi:hypothetical protein